MRFIPTFILMLILVSPTNIQIDPKLQKYVDLFESATIRYGRKVDINYPVSFGNIKSGAAGACYKSWLFEATKVVIDSYHFDQLSENQKVSMLFHGFAHCTFNRKHTDEKIGKYPKSWMYDTLFKFPDDLKEAYIKEIITGDDSDIVRKLTEISKQCIVR